MAAVGIKTSVLVIPNPEWSMTSNDFAHVPANLSFTQDLPSNIRTLSTNSISQGDTATGLLYVPDLEPQDPCVNSSSPYVPANVTRQANLPNKDYDLIAIAPWISAECTLAYLASARSDPIHAFLFFPPDHRTAEPPLPNDPMWNLNDGGDWKAINRFPVYAIPGQVGWTLMNQSSHYSGNMTDVEFGQVLSEMHDSRDYVRLYTEISTGSRNTLPSLWVFLVIVLAVLLVIIFITSFTMRWIQKKRRQALRRRVAEGEVDLEALGIKRVTVPKDVLEKLPLFVYVAPGAGRDGCAEDPPNAPVQVPTSESALPDPLPDGSPRINHPTPSPSLPRRVLPFSQSTCPICLDDFTSAVTTVRELPCSHIFHPECVDDFFQTTSSLCPLCKKSILPAGHCPPTVTNTMVRRERMIRRMRERVVVPDMGMGLDGETGSGVDYSQVLTPPTVMMRVTAGLSGLTSLRFPYRRRQSSASPRTVPSITVARAAAGIETGQDLASTVPMQRIRAREWIRTKMLRRRDGEARDTNGDTAGGGGEDGGEGGIEVGGEGYIPVGTSTGVQGGVQEEATQAAQAEEIRGEVRVEEEGGEEPPRYVRAEEVPRLAQASPPPPPPTQSSSAPARETTAQEEAGEGKGDAL